jgi:hypothetical protein
MANLLIVFALPVHAAHIVSSQWADTSDDWVKLTFALRQRNLDHLERLLLNVSNPRHELWGKHLSFEEVNGLVAPHPDSISAVEGWLRRFGVSSHIGSTPNKDFIHATMPLRQAEAMLGANFTVMQHARSRAFAMRSPLQSIPDNMQPHLDFVHSALRSPPAHLDLSLDESIKTNDDPDPMHLFSNGKPRHNFMVASSSSAKRGFRLPVQHHTPAHTGAAPKISLAKLFEKEKGEFGMSPAKILHRYNELEGHQGFSARGILPIKKADTFKCDGVPVGQAAASFLGERADIDGDLQQFFGKFFPKGQGQKPIVRLMDAPYKGGSTGTTPTGSSHATAEASLDLQYLMAIGAGVTTELWATSGRSTDPHTTQPGTDQNEPFLQWLVSLSKTRCPPAVFSVSYADNENSYDKFLADRINHEFKKVRKKSIAMCAHNYDLTLLYSWLCRLVCAELASWWPPATMVSVAHGMRLVMTSRVLLPFPEAPRGLRQWAAPSSRRRTGRPRGASAHGKKWHTREVQGVSANVRSHLSFSSH